MQEERENSRSPHGPGAVDPGPEHPRESADEDLLEVELEVSAHCDQQAGDNEQTTQQQVAIVLAA